MLYWANKRYNEGKLNIKMKLRFQGAQLPRFCSRILPFSASKCAKVLIILDFSNFATSFLYGNGGIAAEMFFGSRSPSYGIVFKTKQSLF